MVRKCYTNLEERDALKEEVRKLNVRGMEELRRLEGREKTIAILGDGLWPKTLKQDGDRRSKYILCNIGMKRNERPNVAGVSIRSSIGVQSRRGCVVIGQMTEESNTLGTPSLPAPMLT